MIVHAVNRFFMFCIIISLFIQTTFICKLFCEAKTDSKCEIVNAVSEKKDIPSANFNNHVIVGGNVWDCKVWDACDDILGFEAILSLHQRLDDDANGNVDISESDDFLRDELKYENGYERQKGFHRNDKHITADELWLTWKSSEVHNWTVEDTINWLVSNVELPQYAKNFQEQLVDGTALPRMAVNSMHFLSNLGIKDPIHKQKISLKAMDIVLFGPSKNHNYLKDILLALSLIIAVGGCWFAYIQHKKAQSHLRKTMKDMESLQHAEESLLTLQKELDKAKLEQEIVATEKENLERRLQLEITTVKKQDSLGSSSDQTKIQRLEEELRIVLGDLHSVEKALQEKSWLPVPELQHWLQLTYELELQHYNGKKAAAEQQLASAKEGCEKLRKKRLSFLGTFRVAHGSSIDDVDNRILQAKAALSEVTKDLQERLHRWKQIEMLCGFSIVHNPGIPHLQSVLGTGIGSIVSSKSNLSARMPRTNSESTLADDDSSHSFPHGVSARSLVSIPYTCNQRPNLALNLGEHAKRVPTPDLKSCASSSAILQRSDAVCCDHSDSHSTDGFEYESFEDSVGSYGFSDPSRPVFVVGESSKDAILKAPHGSVLSRRSHGIAKISKFSEHSSSFPERPVESTGYSMTSDSSHLKGIGSLSLLQSDAVSKNVEENVSNIDEKLSVLSDSLQKAKTA